MDRRKFVKGTALSLSGLATGIIATNQLSQSVKAQVEASAFGLSGDSIATPDGQISSLTVSVDASWSYDLPGEKNPKTWTVALLVHRDGDSEIIDKATGDAMYLTSSGDVSLNGGVLKTNLYEAPDFYSTNEGETLVSKIPFSLLFVVESPNAEVIAKATNQTRVPLEVTNEAFNASKHGTVDGSGSLNVSD